LPPSPRPAPLAASPSPADRARGALLGLALGGPVPVALARILADALLEPSLDLGRMVGRWTALLDGPVADSAELGPALRYLRDRGAPPLADEPAAARDLAAHVVPIALLTHAQPANLLSGTWHVAAITHPGDDAAWSAVALNVAMARLLQGFRDVVPDVIEALRENAAPAALLERVRRLPLTRQDDLDPASPLAVPALETTLWLAAREPIAERGLAWLAERGATTGVLAAAGALFGARHGATAVVSREASEDLEHLAALAPRLARLVPG
jgi:hypothetical protein